MSYFYRHSDQFTPACPVGRPGDVLPANGISENLETFIYSARYADTSAKLVLFFIFCMVGVYVVRRCKGLFVNAKSPMERMGAILISVSICLWSLSIAYWNIERKPFFYGETSYWKDEVSASKPVSESVDFDWQLNRCGNLWELVDLKCMARKKGETTKCPSVMHQLLDNGQASSEPYPECNQKKEVDSLLGDNAYWDERAGCVVNKVDRQVRYTWHESKKIGSSLNSFLSASFSNERFDRPYSVLNWVALTLIIFGLLLRRGKVDHLLRWIRGN